MPFRILFLAHSAQRGGAEFCLNTTLQYLDRSRFEPYVIFPTEGPMVESARKMGIPTEIVPLCWWMLYEPSFWEWKNRLRIPQRLYILRRFIREHSIQAVYSNTVCLFEGVLAARLTGIPHYTHIHEVLEDRFMQPRWFTLPKIVRFFCQNSRNVFFESEPSRKIAEELLCKKFGSKADPLCRKMAVISNSARLSREEVQNYSATPADEAFGELAKYGVQTNPWTLLWLGRFSERKNPQMLLDAVGKLPREISEKLQVLFVGAGPLEPLLRERVQREKLEHVCKIVPFQEDVRPLLKLAKTLILTSWEESFGLVLVEAGMFGIPTVAVRSQGPCEIIQDEKTGYLVNPDDSETLAQKITQLVHNADLCESLGKQNRLRVWELYDPQKNTRKMEGFWTLDSGR